MLIRTIAHYLMSHKRLVVPQLGAFLVKEPGRSVLFSEMLKRDDGVLRSLLQAEGLGEVEAAGEIDRFVFEVRHAVQNGREYRMGEFGVLQPGPNGTIAFVFMPSSAGRSAAQAEGARAPRVDPARLAESVRTAFAESRASEAAKGDADASEHRSHSHKGHRHRSSGSTHARSEQSSRRRGDRFIWVALLAMLLALGAIAFGVWQGAQDRQPEEEFYRMPIFSAILSTVSDFFGSLFHSGQ